MKIDLNLQLNYKLSYTLSWNSHRQHDCLVYEMWEPFSCQIPTHKSGPHDKLGKKPVCKLKVITSNHKKKKKFTWQKTITCDSVTKSLVSTSTYGKFMSCDHMECFKS